MPNQQKTSAGERSRFMTISHEVEPLAKIVAGDQALAKSQRSDEEIVEAKAPPKINNLVKVKESVEDI